MKKICILTICLVLVGSSSGCSWLADFIICNITDEDLSDLSESERRAKYEQDFFDKQDREERLRQQKERIIYPTCGDWRDSLPRESGK